MNANHQSLKNLILIESLIKMYAKNLTAFLFKKTLPEGRGWEGQGKMLEGEWEVPAFGGGMRKSQEEGYPAGNIMEGIVVVV